jgi:uncharacterized protein (DUF2141 family)
MKHLYLTLLIFFSSFCAFAQNLKVSIEITNVQTGKGSVILNLYDKEAAFFKTAYLSKSVKAEKETIIMTVEVPAGTYAISLFQDLNSDGKLKQNWIGIPQEPVGLGNNFKPSFSAPKFNDCAVKISGTNNHFTIKLN